jgi:hypothetical protein
MSWKNVRPIDDPYESLELDATPDSSALFAPDLGTEEVYTLSVKWP